jgi:hypothetical protein
MSVHALRPVDEQTDATETPPVDARAELRDSLNAQQATCARVDALLRGIEHAEEIAAKADAAVVAAEEAVAAAKARDATAAANASLKGKARKEGTTRQARESLTDALDEQEIANDAVAKLREQLPALREELAWCEVKVLIARNQLLVPLVDQLSERIRQRQLALNADLLMLGVLCEADEIPAQLEHIEALKAKSALSAPTAESTAAAKRTLQNHGIAESDWDERKRTADAIRAVLDGLLENADAPLPEI